MRWSMGRAALLLAFLNAGMVWADDPLLQGVGALVSPRKATTLEELAKDIYPNDRRSQDAYVAALVRVNPDLFTGSAQPGRLKLAKGTKLLMPTGLAVPVTLVDVVRQAPPIAAGGPPPGAVTQAAAQRGVKTCLPRIEQISSALSRGGKVGVFLFNSLDKPDASVLSTSMEVAEASGTTYASSTYAPQLSGECQAVVEQVAWWPARCPDVAEKVFAPHKTTGALMKEILVVEGDRRVRIFLMPAGTGCVSIKKEAIF